MKCIRMWRVGDGSFRSWFGVNRSTFHKDMRNNDFSFSISSDLDLWPLDLEFALSVSRVHGNVSTKFKVYMAVRFRINGRHRTDGRTDGVQHLMQPHMERCIIKLMARRTEPCWPHTWCLWCWRMDTGSHYIIVGQSVSQSSQWAGKSDGQEMNTIADRENIGKIKMQKWTLCPIAFKKALSTKCIANRKTLQFFSCRLNNCYHTTVKIKLFGFQSHIILCSLNLTKVLILNVKVSGRSIADHHQVPCKLLIVNSHTKCRRVQPINLLIDFCYTSVSKSVAEWLRSCLIGITRRLTFKMFLLSTCYFSLVFSWAIVNCSFLISLEHCPVICSPLSWYKAYQSSVFVTDFYQQLCVFTMPIST